jgi:glutathione S-transferase
MAAMNIYPGPMLITLASSLLLFACSAYVGRCRMKFAIKAPATSGHPQFEIAYRIQMNTLENTVAFLPVLWVFALNLSSSGQRCSVAAGLLARVWYALAYARDPEDARRGLRLSMLCFAALGLGGAWGVLRGLIA